MHDCCDTSVCVCAHTCMHTQVCGVCPVASSLGASFLLNNIILIVTLIDSPPAMYCDTVEEPDYLPLGPGFQKFVSCFVRYVCTNMLVILAYYR